MNILDKNKLKKGKFSDSFISNTIDDIQKKADKSTSNKGVDTNKLHLKFSI